MTQAEASAILVRLNTAAYALQEALHCADWTDNDALYEMIAQSFTAAVEARDTANKLVTRLVERKTE